MKKSKLLLMGLVLGMSTALSACSALEYPSFGPLPEGEKYDVGILLPVTHDALGQAVDGFVDGLKDGGFESGKNLNVITKNAEGSSDDQLTFAKNLMDTCDLTLGVGTGAAKDLKSAQRNKGSKNPILFTAVTDPVDAKLVNSNEKPGGFVTGSSDAAPIVDQIGLIKDCIPTVDKIGIFYTQTETNSEVQARQAKAAIDDLGGITSVIRTCTNSTDISTAITSLVAEDGLDAIYIPTDNNVAANMNYVKSAVKGKNILVVSGEEGQLKGGAQITLSISYFELGKRCGEMAVKILKGEAKPQDLPVVTMTKNDCNFVMSSANLADAGVTLPQEILDKCTDIDK